MQSHLQLREPREGNSWPDSQSCRAFFWCRATCSLLSAAKRLSRFSPIPGWSTVAGTIQHGTYLAEPASLHLKRFLHSVSARNPATLVENGMHGLHTYHDEGLREALDWVPQARPASVFYPAGVGAVKVIITVLAHFVYPRRLGGRKPCEEPCVAWCPFLVTFSSFETMDTVV